MFAINEGSQKAAQSLDIAWDGRLPVDVHCIASSLMMEAEIRGHRKLLPIRLERESPFSIGDASGYAEIREDEEEAYFACGFNVAEPDVRQRFTIAHEIGHVILNHLRIGEVRKRDVTFQSNSFDPDEAAANAYAAALLMPENAVRYYVHRGSGIEELADIFEVSPISMKYRLKNLNIL